MPGVVLGFGLVKGVVGVALQNSIRQNKYTKKHIQENTWTAAYLDVGGCVAYIRRSIARERGLVLQRREGNE